MEALEGSKSSNKEKSTELNQRCKTMNLSQRRRRREPEEEEAAAQKRRKVLPSKEKLFCLRKSRIILIPAVLLALDLIQPKECQSQSETRGSNLNLLSISNLNSPKSGLAGPEVRRERRAAISSTLPEVAGGEESHANREELDESRPANSLAVDYEAAEPNSRGSPSLATISAGNGSRPLQIVRLLAPEAAQNGTQNVTIDCMFKFDRKLDQRLTVKWFFNDELEPIYQWIPELNKRVYSDKYERFLDKSYQVSEDADFMLQAYKWLIATGDQQKTFDQLAGSPALPLEAGSSTSSIGSQEVEGSPAGGSLRLLASRLNKLAKLGGRHSRQLLDSLRVALLMEQPEFSRFRALRLIKPTTELNGRFTCSVSSLDGDDIKSTRLVIYEPARSFTFNVSRPTSNSGQLSYNLTCQAQHIFPRPSLLLLRYKPGPFELASPTGRRSRQPLPVSLRPEPLPGTQSQLTVNWLASSYQPSLISAGADGLELEAPNDILERPAGGGEPPLVFGISSWALVDESSLSSNLASQFECLLLIEGATGYEQRQSLALQRGWHVNSAALTSRSSLLGLFSALASLLCLLLALASSLLIFKLLRRQATNRVHEKQEPEALPAGVNSPEIEASNSDNQPAAKLRVPSLQPPSLTDVLATKHQFGLPAVNRKQPQPQNRYATNESDGVYRVPETSSFGGTRFIIGPRSALANNYYNRNDNNSLQI